MSKRRTFSTWLQTQEGRNDPVGDLARAAQADAHAPVWAFRPAKWRNYLLRKGAGRDALETINGAFLEFADRR